MFSRAARHFLYSLLGTTCTRLQTNIGRIVNLLSQEADNAGLPSNLFTASCDSDQRRMILNITDSTYSLKIPTDIELQELAVWQEMNSIVGNYEAHS